MTRFEEIGKEHQLNARSIHEANKRFEVSCEICSTRGIRVECDSCAIRFAHEGVVANMKDIAEIRQKKIESALKDALGIPVGVRLG